VHINRVDEANANMMAGVRIEDVDVFPLLAGRTNAVVGLGYGNFG